LHRIIIGAHISGGYCYCEESIAKGLFPVARLANPAKRTAVPGTSISQEKQRRSCDATKIPL